MTPTKVDVDPEQLRMNIDLAWRSHTAQENWTAKADTKASISLTVNGALLTAVLAARTQKGSYLEQIDSWREALFGLAIGLVGLAVLMAGATVFPVLGRVRAHRLRRDTIYFGDLRHREPADLRDQLARLTPQDHLGQLARQLIVMARYNWIKHRVLQTVLATAASGYVLLLVVLVS